MNGIVGTSSTGIYPTNPVSLNPTAAPSLECLSGTVYLPHYSLVWIEVPSGNNESPDAVKMGGYPELFKEKGEHVLCLRVTVTNAESANWASGPWDKLDGLFPSQLPIEYFFGKEEGDIVELICTERNKKFSLTCQQQGSQFEANGLFKSEMERLFMITYNLFKDKMSDEGDLEGWDAGAGKKPISEEYEGGFEGKEQERWKIISEIKEKHYPNSKVTSRGNECVVQ